MYIYTCILCVYTAMYTYMRENVCTCIYIYMYIGVRTYVNWKCAHMHRYCMHTNSAHHPLSLSIYIYNRQMVQRLESCFLRGRYCTFASEAHVNNMCVRDTELDRSPRERRSITKSPRIQATLHVLPRGFCHRCHLCNRCFPWRQEMAHGAAIGRRLKM